jgi:hypothetical protein
MLEVQRSRAWYDIVPLDESWFYLTTDHEFIWLPAGEKVPNASGKQFNPKRLC